MSQVIRESGRDATDTLAYQNSARYLGMGIHLVVNEVEPWAVLVETLTSHEMVNFIENNTVGTQIPLFK